MLNLYPEHAHEGYVKYTAEHTITPPIKVPHWKQLNEARTLLHKLRLVGVTSQGIGYGNLSIRFQGEEFLITGTNTGAYPELSTAEYCLVRSFDIKRNSIVSCGPVQASSESMTHGAVYNSGPEVNCVIHIHSKSIFDGMIRDSYPATPKNAAYGTPEIALAIEKCVLESGKNEGVIVMNGHDEGIIAYGASVEKTLNLILELYNKYK
ncbi:MAG: class II aldolase/adducin family protein [Endomicrobia bacterium]|nr:class II aldolase/adducin family protein [Endomicrobiia bacterium]